MMEIAFTIRRKVAVLSLLLNLLLWIFTGISVYHFISGQLYENVDAFLETEGIGVTDSIAAVLASEFRDPLAVPRPEDIRRRLRDPSFIKLAVSWFDERKDQPKPYRTTVTIYDITGAPLASSNAAFREEKLTEAYLEDLLSERRKFDSFVSPKVVSNYHEVRRASFCVSFKGQDVAVVQVLTLVDAVNESLRSVSNSLFLALPVLLLLTLAFELYLMKQAFRPVHDIIRTAKSITELNLKLRVPLPGTRDEIRDLAETFNTMLDRIDQAFDYQTRLVEDISHQLRTPLSILKGELETGLRRVRTAKEYEEILASNLDEVNRIIRVTENLLLIVHYENGSAVLNSVRLDLATLAEDCVEHVAPLFKQKRIGVELKSEGSSRTFGDKHKLRQVLLNLLDNSIKYSRENSLIRLETGSRGGAVYFTISDQGIGIAKEELPHVFERFYRSREARKEKGFGLGLNICKSIVDLHGGKISIQSDPGKGTTVTLEFPAIASSQA